MSSFSTGNGAPTGSRNSRFMNDFVSDHTSSFQNGVNHSIWANEPAQLVFGSRFDAARTTTTFDVTSNGDSFQSRPSSSSSRLASGMTGFGQAVNGDASPIGQRSRPVASRPLVSGANYNSLRGPTSFVTPGQFAARQPSEPSAVLFGQAGAIDNLQMQANSSSRASSQHRLVSSGIDNSVSALWDTNGLGDHVNLYPSRSNSQAVSRNNSQAVSRNNSLPPSRHGLEPSPTEQTFNMPNFGSLRSGSFTSERPLSHGQHTAAPFGQIQSSQTRKASLQLSSSPGEQLSGIDSAGNGFGPLGDSTTSQGFSSISNSRTIDPMQMPLLQEAMRDTSLGASASNFPSFPINGALQVSLDGENDCPTLEPQHGQISNSSPHRNSNINTSYYNQLRQGRGYNANFQNQGLNHSQSHLLGGWSYPNPMAANNNSYTNGYNNRNHGSGYGISPHVQPGIFDANQLSGQHGFPRSSAGRPSAHASMNSHTTRGGQSVGSRSSFSSGVPAESLLSGNHWAERTRPNNGQKYIETTSECRLKDVLGYVARFCGDQAGSRFLQDKLEAANTDEKEIVFQELLPNTIPLCTDPFGNYVIQKFFEHGTQRQKEQLAEKMRGKVKDLSMNMYGCRCIQKAFEHVLVEQQAVLVRELKPCLHEISQDQHGNHVVQKAIERLPPSDIQFITHGYSGHVLEMSNNAYGCRVIQRLLEFQDAESRDDLNNEIHRCAVNLVRNPFGNYVVQHIIDHGTFEDRERIIGSIIPIMVDLIGNKYASNVVEKCLRRGSDGQRAAIVAKITETDPITGRPRFLKAAMISNYGNYVIQRILKTLPSGPWEPFAEVVAEQLKDVIGDRVADKKVQEFQRLLAAGPKDPNKADSDGEDAKEARATKGSAAVTSFQPPPPPLPIKTITRTQTTSTEENSGERSGTPPSLTRTHPSPQSSSAPSTNESMADESSTSEMVKKPEPVGEHVAGEHIAAEHVAASLAHNI